MSACTACGHPSTKPDPFFYDWRDRRWWIHRCPSCTHQFVFPSVGPAEQAAIYADAYFQADGDWVCGLLGASYEDAEEELRREAGEVLAMLPTHGRLLDIGCAGGVFLDCARARGFAVAGIEINATMAERARSNYGLEVLTARIEDVPEGRWDHVFDIVTMLDVLEHVPNPLDTMRKVARWVKPGGTVFIRGPLSNSRAARLKEAIRRTLGVPKRLPGYPLDANMFNRRSLDAMLRAAGIHPSRWDATHNFANLVARKVA